VLLSGYQDLPSTADGRANQLQDERVDRAAMAGMLNLRDVFELIHDTFDDGRAPAKALHYTLSH
jgi:hypothetical protein